MADWAVAGDPCCTIDELFLWSGSCAWPRRQWRPRSPFAVVLAGRLYWTIAADRIVVQLPLLRAGLAAVQQRRCVGTHGLKRRDRRHVRRKDGWHGWWKLGMVVLVRSGTHRPEGGDRGDGRREGEGHWWWQAKAGLAGRWSAQRQDRGSVVSHSSPESYAHRAAH